MNWPWVSRRAYDVVIDERDRLREQNDALLDHIRRVDRIEHGVPELPRQPRPAFEPMPQELLHYINSYGDERFQKMQRDEAYKRHHKLGQPWSRIMAEVMGEDEDGTKTES